MKKIAKSLIAVAVLTGVAGVMDINGDVDAYLRDAGKIKIAAPQPVPASVVWTPQKEKRQGFDVTRTWLATPRSEAPAIKLVTMESDRNASVSSLTVDGRESEEDVTV